MNVGKPYMRCDTPGCSAPGLSVMRLLTDISSGDSTLGTRLMAARQASQESYGNASQTLRESPWETDIERTKMRRMALEVESEAKEFAEEQRQAALDAASSTEVGAGPELLVLEGDGGMVRTGTLVPIAQGEPKYAETTPGRGLLRRRREVAFREVATMDVRKPGDVEPRAVDAVVSALAPKGEKARRMKALAARCGMGSETEMYGLGDMGSGLHTAFDEAFMDRRAFWEADQTHTRGYVRAAAEVLSADVPSGAAPAETWAASSDGSALSTPAPTGGAVDSCSASLGQPATGEATGAPALKPGTESPFSPDAWKAEMWSAIYARDAEQCDLLLRVARSHRDPSKKPTPNRCRLRASDKCPIDALDTYLTNNWDHLRFAEMKERKLPVVSARAECQVRDRTGGRFGGPASWKAENIEGKAVLRAIIFDKRYPTFVQWCWERRNVRFLDGLYTRIDQAVAGRRLSPDAAALLRSPNTTLADLLNYQPSSQALDPQRKEAAAA